jgi:hypothetical protein
MFGYWASRYRVRWVLGIFMSCIHFTISNSPVSLKGMLKYAFRLASMRICYVQQLVPIPLPQLLYLESGVKF